MTLAAVLGFGPAGHGQDAPAGRPDDLLRAAPFDVITLADNTTLRVEPVSPRPLPEYDAAKVAREAREREAMKKLGRPRRRPRGEPAAEPDADSEPEEELEPTVNIVLLEGDSRDFSVKRRNIKSIDYFEDILLAEADRLTLAADFTRAFEHLLLVKVRDPNWRGLQDAVDKLLLAEGRDSLVKGDEARGLRLLRELHARRPDYPGLVDQLATALGARAGRAFELGAYAVGRRALRDLEAVAPGHAVGLQAAGRYSARAAELAAEAEQAQGFGRLDRLAEALKIWPTAEGLAAKYREAFRAAPTLAVGVIDLPRPLTPWVRSDAAARATRLAYLPVLASADEQAGAGPRPDQLAVGLERADLGRRLIVRLRTDVRWSDGSRPVGSIDVARFLTDRAEPRSPGYDARWAELLDRVVAPAEDRVEIGLARAVLNPEAWLVAPIGPAHADRDGLVPTPGGVRLVVGSGPFPLATAPGPDRAEYAAADPPSGDGPKIRRVVEVRLPDPRAAIAALGRGEVSLLEHVPTDRLGEVRALPGVKVGTYDRPSLHSLALDGRNPALKNRTLRRAIAYAVDRRSILEDTLLRGPVDATNAPADGPFARGSYADAPDVKPLEYDPLLARMLVAATQRELGGDPLKFTFEYPATPDARAAAPRIAEMLREAGLVIEVVERPEAELESGLQSGRRFDLAYRATRCADPATEAGTLISPGYDAPPEADALGSVASPRILQLLLSLDRAPETPTARGILLQIDRESRNELPSIPLWQLEDHYAWRDALRGPAEAARDLYDGILTWEVEPWVPADPS